MARIEKTVFISYRRTDVFIALAVYENLKNHGYDVFFDYTSIASGDFEQIITSNIKARAHFLIILTPTALDRCNELGDWLRREIALAIDEKRNIVPLFFRGFSFGFSTIKEKLTGKLRNLSRYNGLNVHEDYFDEAMLRLRTQYLNVPLNTVLHPVSTEVQKAVREEQVAADKALEQIPDVKELVKEAEEKQPEQKPDLEKELQPETAVKPPQVAEIKLTGYMPVLPWRLFGTIAGGLIVLTFIIWGASKRFSNPPIPPTPTSESDVTEVVALPPTSTLASQPHQINTPSLTKTSVPPTPALTIGSTLTGKDGMTLLYVPAGEFSMGSDTLDNEKPIHKVNLNAFWIDETEVTNKQYAFCVADRACLQPLNIKSPTRSTYYADSQFQNYPVIYVDWYMAKAYCEWAGRRLPTEAEWEKSARGKDGWIYPWGNNAPNDTLLNYNSPNRDTTEVGNYPDGRSPYGAYDMAGNVWEWVSSLHLSYPYDKADGRENLSVYGDRILRGGAWYHLDGSVRPLFNAPYDQPDMVVRSDRRNWFAAKYENISEYSRPPFGFGTVGFRCAMSATP